MKVTFVKVLLLCVVLSIFAFIVSCPVCLVFYCILCFLSSVCMLYVYGCFGEINYDDDSNTWVELITISATTNDLFVPRARLRFGERAFSIAALLPWNSLPAETRNVATLETFKKKLKIFMFYKHHGDWLSFFGIFICTFSSNRRERTDRLSVGSSL